MRVRGVIPPQGDAQALHHSSVQLAKATKDRQELKDIICRAEQAAADILALKVPLSPQRPLHAQDQILQHLKQISGKMKVGFYTDCDCLLICPGRT